MSDDELSEERKHKEHKKHKSSKRHKSGTRDRSRHDRDRRDHGSRDTAPQSTTGPCWQTMQFKLINGVNRYNAGRQEIDGSCIVQGQVADFDMSSFSGTLQNQLKPVSDTRGIQLNARGGGTSTWKNGDHPTKTSRTRRGGAAPCTLTTEGEEGDVGARLPKQNAGGGGGGGEGAGRTVVITHMYILRCLYFLYLHS